MNNLLTWTCGCAIVAGFMMPTVQAPLPARQLYPDATIVVRGASTSYLVFSPTDSNPKVDISAIIPGANISVYQTLQGQFAVGETYPSNHLYLIDVATHRIVENAPLPKDSNGHVYGPQYSPSRHYSTHVTGTADKSNVTAWVLTVTDNRAHTQVQFSSTYKYGSQQNTLNGEPFVVGWNSDETALLVVLIPPNSDGGPQGYDLISLTGVKFSARPTPIVLTTAQPVASAGLRLLLAPDGGHAAYLAVDKNNPAVGFNPPGDLSALYFQPYNTLHLIDLSTLQDQVVASANSGEGMSSLAWTPDGQKLYFMAGAYDNSLLPLRAKLNNYDVATKQLTVGSVLLDDPTGVVLSLLPCDGTLYLSVSTRKGIYFQFTSYSDFSKLRFMGGVGANAAFDSCVIDPNVKVPTPAVTPTSKG